MDPRRTVLFVRRRPPFSVVDRPQSRHDRRYIKRRSVRWRRSCCRAGGRRKRWRSWRSCRSTKCGGWTTGGKATR